MFPGCVWVRVALEEVKDQVEPASEEKDACLGYRENSDGTVKFILGDKGLVVRHGEADLEDEVEDPEKFEED